MGLEFFSCLFFNQWTQNITYSIYYSNTIVHEALSKAGPMISFIFFHSPGILA